jgi:RNA polymerase sigma factor (sigma-70 family)
MGSGLEAVLLNNREALLRFLRARGAGEEAEDLFQELWMKALLMKSGPVSEPLAYLYRSANNLLLDRRRAELRRQRREHVWSAASEAEEPSLQEQSADRILAAREELRALEATLSALGERTETIFRRFRLDGQSQRDIAQDLGISLSAVEKHLQKAYRALLQFRRDRDAD